MSIPDMYVYNKRSNVFQVFKGPPQHITSVDYSLGNKQLIAPH